MQSFCNNFRKREPIIIILSLWRSEMNFKEGEIKSSTSPPACCHTTLQNMNVQLCNYSFILARIIYTSDDNFVLE